MGLDGNAEFAGLRIAGDDRERVNWTRWFRVLRGRWDRDQSQNKKQE
jgi:hypothetical protein